MLMTIRQNSLPLASMILSGIVLSTIVDRFFEEGVAMNFQEMEGQGGPTRHLLDSSTAGTL